MEWTRDPDIWIVRDVDSSQTVLFEEWIELQSKFCTRYMKYSAENTYILMNRKFDDQSLTRSTLLNSALCVHVGTHRIHIGVVMPNKKIDCKWTSDNEDHKYDMILLLHTKKLHRSIKRGVYHVSTAKSLCTLNLFRQDDMFQTYYDFHLHFIRGSHGRLFRMLTS